MKPIAPENVLVRPFKTYKTHVYEYVHPGGDEGEIAVNEALSPPSDWMWNENDEPINSGSTVYKYPLYASLKQMFYPDVSLLYPDPVQKVSGSVISMYSGSWSYFGTGSLRRPPAFDRMFSLDSHSKVYVVNVDQQAYGERIYPDTFKISSPDSTASFYDDGYGRLVSSEDSTLVVGNIFYPFGIAVIGEIPAGPATSSILNHEGLFLVSGSELEIEYQSQYTIYEHTVICTMERGEFNFSTNASLNTFASSSVSGSTKLFDALLEGELTPYFTTLGLFNSSGEMVAIAKTPYPIRRLVEADQSVVIKFDI